MRRRLAVAGELPADQAWRRYAWLSEWPRWAPAIFGVGASGMRLVPGLTGSLVGPLGVRAEFVVDAVDEQSRTWSWTVRSGPLRLHLDHEVLARPLGGTVATLELEGAAPVVLGYLPAARWALGRLVAP